MVPLASECSAVTTTELSTQLRLLGLGPDAVTVYLHLLESGPLGQAELAEPCGADTVRDGLSELTEVGLVGAVGEQDAGFAPVAPETGLAALSLRREAELQQARVDALNAYEVFRRSVYSQSTEDLVEVVTGDAITDRIEQVTRAARTEIRRLDSPPYYFTRSVNPVEHEHLAAGVGYRVVYAQAALQRPGYLSGNILPSIEAGEQARVLPDVPVKLTIVDSSVALVSLAIGEAECNRSLLMVRPCSLFSALVGLFEVSWRTALPVDVSGAAPEHRLKPVERTLLALLAAGASDEAIARELGVSRRTFFRHLERLMHRSGATSRFQLALHAARHEWV